MTLQAVVSPTESAPHRGLAFGVLHEAVKAVKTCPKTTNKDDLRYTSPTRTRFVRALEVLEWADSDNRSFTFWCEVAEILPEWMTRQIYVLAEDRPMLMKAWEG